MYMRDTIAGIATPLGEGGIGIVRISGDKAADIGRKIFRCIQDGGLESHRFYYGRIIDPLTGSLIDEGMFVYMRAPRSYTREDVVEIHCHGGYLMVQRLLQLTVREGARLAEPGEFTKRAFLNGRIDLLQAEAVIDIIRGKSAAALQLAEHQREGVLSLRISDLRSCLVKALALVEAWIDFPEEELDDISRERISAFVEEARGRSEALISGYGRGKIMREGVAVSIVGKPNVGKSSLLNALLEEDRAIVTDLPGTTRDVIEENLNVKGLGVRLIDTAGIRHTDDLVEQQGVQRSLEKISQADLVLFLVDGSRPFDEEDRRIAAAVAGKKVLVVLTKGDLPRVADLPADLNFEAQVIVSTLAGSGLDELRDALFGLFMGGGASDNRDLAPISHARHLQALEQAHSHLRRFVDNYQQSLDLEFLAADLRQALASVGEITGETTPDEILDHIFSQFCIGK